MKRDRSKSTIEREVDDPAFKEEKKRLSREVHEERTPISRIHGGDDLLQPKVSFFLHAIHTTT